jgi:IPT/TIG domain
MGKARSILLAALFFTVVPIAAWAQAPGQITALIVTPTPAQANQTVSISVAWVGNCSGEAILDFGDGSPNTVVPIPSLAPVTHSYTQTATLKVSAGPTAACGGQAIATLPVANTSGVLGALYCAFFGCNPTISSMPFSNVTPGGQLIISGSGFGNQPGTVQIVLQSFYNQLIYGVPVAASDWSSGLVVATMPSGIEGVVAQNASFQIITNNSSASNAYFQAFRPKLQMMTIEWNRIPCIMNMHSPSDDCQGQGGFNTPAECSELPAFGEGNFPYNPPAYTANHGSGWQLFGASDRGTDTFYISPPLQNSWVNAGGATFVSASDSGSSASLFTPITSAPVTTLAWQVGWNVSACSWASYFGNIFIQGPAGVPY